VANFTLHDFRTPVHIEQGGWVRPEAGLDALEERKITSNRIINNIFRLGGEAIQLTFNLVRLYKDS
jgi:hypothetical protein